MVAQAVSSTHALQSALKSLPGPVFAVIDGAQFADVPASLAEAGLSSEPLFLEGVHPSARTNGPHLAALLYASDIDLLFSVLQNRSACVFWSWPDGQAALFRHLRGLNAVQIPRDMPTLDARTQMHDVETVFFRHYDPNVLVALWPLLTPAQTSRLLGSAEALVLDAPDFGNSGKLHRPAALPPQPVGMLRLNATQYEALSDRLAQRDQLRMRRYLERNPPPTGALSKRKMDQIINESAQSGRKMGLRTEQGHARWAYLMQITDGKAARMPAVQALMGRQGADPDRDVSKLLDIVAASLRAKAPR